MRQLGGQKTPYELLIHISNADDSIYNYIRSVNKLRTDLLHLVQQDSFLNRVNLISTNKLRVIDKDSITEYPLVKKIDQD
jgi:hypothetical protein